VADLKQTTGLVECTLDALKANRQKQIVVRDRLALVKAIEALAGFLNRMPVEKVGATW
jgi:hypothetical protein